MCISPGRLSPDNQEPMAVLEMLGNPMLRLGVSFPVFLLALIVPCCGYLGAHRKQRTCCTCCFAWCNCCTGFIQVLVVLLCGLGIVTMSILTVHCKHGLTKEAPVQDACLNVMYSCKYRKNQFDPTTYDRCYEHMFGHLPLAIGFFSVLLALHSFIGCIACASFWWGRKLYSSSTEKEMGSVVV